MREAREALKEANILKKKKPTVFVFLSCLELREKQVLKIHEEPGYKHGLTLVC